MNVCLNYGDHDRPSVTLWQIFKSLFLDPEYPRDQERFGGAGGTGRAMSVTMRQPCGVLIHSTIMRKGFGTGFWPA